MWECAEIITSRKNYCWVTIMFLFVCLIFCKAFILWAIWQGDLISLQTKTNVPCHVYTVNMSVEPVSLAKHKHWRQAETATLDLLNMTNPQRSVYILKKPRTQVFGPKTSITTSWSHLHHNVSNHELYDTLQSGFRTHHSIETPLIRITNNLLIAANSSYISTLILLDLSASFDTVRTTQFS